MGMLRSKYQSLLSKGGEDIEKHAPQLEAAGREALAKLQNMSSSELEQMLASSRKFRSMIPRFDEYVQVMETLIAHRRAEEAAEKRE